MRGSLEDAIVGLWSNLSLGGDYAMEDDSLAFRSDGSGWFSFSRPGVHEVREFKWAIETDRLVIRWTRKRSKPTKCDVSIGMMKDLSGKKVRALSVDFFIGSPYAFVSRKPSDLATPKS